MRRSSSARLPSLIGCVAALSLTLAVLAQTSPPVGVTDPSTANNTDVNSAVA